MSKIDLTTPEQNLAESTADVVDEMLRIDGQTNAIWRQLSRALRAGDLKRAFELLEQVKQSAAESASYAVYAAKGVFVLWCTQQVAKGDPDKATGEDLEHLINMTTPPHAKDPDGGN